MYVLRKYIPDNSVDLIYLDPPFNSQATYNVLFEEESGEKSQSQIEAFEDFWTWDDDAQKTFEYLTTDKNVPANVTDLILALERLLGKNSMSAYLVMMSVRLIELRRVLKPTGSLYLHCDPTASHFLKIVLDSIFGVQNFRNEIIWKRTSGHSDAIGFGCIHDVILFYTRSDKVIWNDTRQEYDKEYVEAYYRYSDPDGRKWMSGDASASGLQGGGYEYEWKGVKRIWRFPIDTMRKLDTEGRIFYTKNGIPRVKRYLDESEGLPAQDLWTDIEALRSWHKNERLGYQTQKPVALLERIIKASSKNDAVILDPFCGCGTTIDAVEKLNLGSEAKRTWIGIDITHLAINLIKRRIRDKYPNANFEVIGEPKDLQSAIQLAHNDRYQFEWWALSLIDARPINDKKKGSDRGIDGIIYLLDPNTKTTKSVLVQVKSGHVNSSYIRDFKGTLEREKAKFGVFITLEEPTKDMKEEALTYGSELAPLNNEERVPRIQILTIKELLEGTKPKVLYVNISYKKARHEKEKKSKRVIGKKVGKYKKLAV